MITLKIILEHIVAMEQRLSGQIGDVKTQLASVERNLLRQIDGIDKRLDDIEIDTTSRSKRYESSMTEFVLLGLSERYAVREDVAEEEQLLTF